MSVHIVEFLGVKVRIKNELYDDKPLAELLKTLDMLEKRLAKNEKIADAIRKLGRMTILLTAPPRSIFNSWLRALKASRGISYSEKKLIRLHNITPEVVLEEILHLTYPELREYEIAELVAGILGIRPRHDRILDEFIVASDGRGDGYLIPRQELCKLVKKRRLTEPAVTEDGRVIYLSAKQRSQYWMMPLMTSDYLPTRHKAQIIDRLRRAHRLYDEILGKEETLLLEQ